MHQVALLAEYAIRLAPGLLVLGVALWLLGNAAPALRIALLILGFVLLRDLMTPLGLWTFGRGPGGLLWLRFIDDAVVLIAFGLTGVALTALVLRTQRELAGYLSWGRLDGAALLRALGAAAVLAVPLLGALQLVPLAERGGPVAASLLLPLLVLTLGGNLMEEVLFRGFLQGYLTAQGLSAGRTILLSGLFFAGGHVFLASTVTDLGWPVLVFTLAEGLACAWVRQRSGVLAATLTHGLVIFALASGL